MTQPGATGATNIAGDSAHVSMQAGAVHGDVHIYTVPAGASPKEKFETGVRCLDGGMARRAWQLINEAALEGYATDEVHFYWLLALVSGRTRRELSREEVNLLRDPSRIFVSGVDNAWADGVRVVRRLLKSAEKDEEDIRVLLKEVDRLDAARRALVVRHLEIFLEGPVKDQMWRRALAQAKEAQMAGRRVERAWKFFQADPLGPRLRRPPPVRVPILIWVLVVVFTVFWAVAAVHIGYLLAQGGWNAVLLVYLASVGRAGREGSARLPAVLRAL